MKHQSTNPRHPAHEQEAGNPTPGNRKEESKRREEKAEESKVKDVSNRARKGYHNDGPGGSYNGY